MKNENLEWGRDKNWFTLRSVVWCVFRGCEEWVLVFPKLGISFLSAFRLVM